MNLTEKPFWQAANPSASATWALPVPLLPSAMNSAGYGGGAVRALDFYQQGEAQTYHWDNSKSGWIKNLEPEGANS